MADLLETARRIRDDMIGNFDGEFDHWAEIISRLIVEIERDRPTDTADLMDAIAADHIAAQADKVKRRPYSEFRAEVMDKVAADRREAVARVLWLRRGGDPALWDGIGRGADASWKCYMAPIRKGLLADADAVLSLIAVPDGMVIPKVNAPYAEDHPLLKPILEKRARAAGNFSPEFSGQRGQDFDRGLLCAFEAVNGALQRIAAATGEA